NPSIVYINIFSKKFQVELDFYIYLQEKERATENSINTVWV
ncbi:hypothetical protein CDAR_125861, partial [Caerostris darwini]